MTSEETPDLMEALIESLREKQWTVAASVVRSIAHDQTWVGHPREFDLHNTPAGPLRTVKRYIEEMMPGGRWRRDGDSWDYELPD